MASAALFSSLGFQPVGVYDWAKIQGWRRANVSYRPLLDPGSSLVEQWHVLFAVRNWDCDHTLNSDILIGLFRQNLKQILKVNL